MMCSNLVDLQATIDVFEKEKVEYLHIDVMDGEFVPNFGLGVDYIRGLRELTSIPLDLHLMIKDPEYKLPWIGIHKEDIVTIHYESTFQVQRALDYLVPYGCKRFLAINPATPIGQIEEVLDYIDGVNLLMVNPGFAGQKIVPSTLRKAEKLQKSRLCWICLKVWYGWTVKARCSPLRLNAGRYWTAASAIFSICVAVCSGPTVSL